MTTRPKWEFTTETFNDFDEWTARREELERESYEYTASFRGHDADPSYVITIGRRYAHTPETEDAR